MIIRLMLDDPSEDQSTACEACQTQDGPGTGVPVSLASANSANLPPEIATHYEILRQ